MIQSIFLISILFLAQSSATTISISASDDVQICGKTSESCSAAASQPSAEEIRLIRESWPIIKKNKNVLAEFVLEHFRVHPKTQDLLPELAGVALADLPSNAFFVQLTETYVVFALNEITDNLDNSGVLSNLLQCLHPEWYVDFVPIDQQNKETLRIFYKVLEEQMGDQLSEKTKAAWVKGMNYAFTFLKMKPGHTNVNSFLASNDIVLVRQFYAANRNNMAIVTKALMKMFTEHPESQKLVPALAAVPLNKLANNEDFLVLAHFSSAVASFIVSNLDNEDVLSHILAQQTTPEMFVSYMDPIYQLDETAHVVMTAIKEEVSIDEATEKALKNVMAYVNGIMASKVAANSDVKSVAEPVVSAKNKGLIRATWDQMRFNAEIAPKIMLKMFTTYPETQSMFPQFAQVAVSQLSNNLQFLAATYSVFSGMNFIVSNVDDSESITKLISKMDSPIFFVPKPSVAPSFEEINQIVLEVLKEELGSKFTSEHASAWTSLMTLVNRILEENITIKPISSEEKHVLIDNLKMTKGNKKFGANMLLKMFLAHPKTQSLFPNFAKLPVSSLSNNAEFVAFGKMMVSGIEMLVNMIDQPETLRQLLGNKPIGQYFVADIPLDQQLEETARLVIDAFDEELGVRFTPMTRNIWKRAFLLANSIMEESI